MKGIVRVHLRAECGCGVCTDWSDREEGPVQHAAFLQMPGGTRQWRLPAAVAVEVCWEHRNGREGCWGNSLPKSTPNFSAPILWDKLCQGLLEMFLKKYCLACAAPSIYLVLLVLLQKSVGGHPVWLVVTLGLPKANWYASCSSLLKIRISRVHIPWEGCGIARPDGKRAEQRNNY